MALEIQAVGTLTFSTFKEKFGTPRQGTLTPTSRGKIELNPQLPQGLLDGLEGFSHAWLIWHCHSQGSFKKGKVRPPRLDGKKIGIFASRSPHRPNPIGLSLVKIEEVLATCLWVSGLDLIEGTPILDIKPYVETDQVTGAEFGWLKDFPIKPMQISYSSESLEYLEKLAFEQGHRLQELIYESLSLDPRPLGYKRIELQGPQQVYAVRIEEFDVKFKLTDTGFEICYIDMEYKPTSRK